LERRKVFGGGSQTEDRRGAHEGGRVTGFQSSVVSLSPQLASEAAVSQTVGPDSVWLGPATFRMSIWGRPHGRSPTKYSGRR
jgi:hypothetical protein